MKKLLLIALCLSANCFSYSQDDLKKEKLFAPILYDILERAEKKYLNEFALQVE